ncbi:type-F conjugative transfer system pilin assembly protein TrbC [Enterovibrio paralichthyis]|uniref:type-F conjugative transfer system pilin assembly protein TrbC n=1 Tax=Enterovibrio paralichthyis TaxID=2853805 RepID=UPI001C481F53|nr:type-F conjugative transfer system pilin assembly protein TrbC [Enterovibrio paralichthyis]MBV7300278.1 type-F conjugative transfer system pilin assembly protein TrbC [Enterovibrio paralichthyis]
MKRLVAALVLIPLLANAEIESYRDQANHLVSQIDTAPQADENIAVLQQELNQAISREVSAAQSLITDVQRRSESEDVKAAAAQLVKESEAYLATQTDFGNGPTPASAGNVDIAAMLQELRAPSIQKANSEVTDPLPELMVFVTLSMPEQALVQLAKQTARAGGEIYIRGFHNNSLKETVTFMEWLSKESGVTLAIDPTMFELFEVTRVPTIIMAVEGVKPCDAKDQLCRRDLPLHDRMTGNTSLHYALEQFTWRGDSSDIAMKHLTRLQSADWNE